MASYAYVTHEGECRLEELYNRGCRTSEDVANYLEKVGYDKVILWNPDQPGAKSARKQGLVRVVKGSVESLLKDIGKENPSLGQVLTTYTKLANEGSSSLSNFELNEAYQVALGFASDRPLYRDFPRGRDFTFLEKSERAIKFDRLVSTLHRDGFDLVPSDEDTPVYEAKALILLEKLAKE